MLLTSSSFPSLTDLSPLISTYLSIRNDILVLLKKISNHFNFKSQTFFLAITYMDELIHLIPQQYHNENTLILHNDLYIKAFTCLIIASKYQEIDCLIPNLRKYIDCYHVYCNKHSPFVTTEMLRHEEVNVLTLLKYKLCYYSIYDYIVFMFCHGVVTKDELMHVDNDINESKMKRNLERIYIKARELLDKVICMKEMVYYVGYRECFAMYIMERSVKEVLFAKKTGEDDIAFRKVVVEMYKSDYYKDEQFEKIKQKVEEWCKWNGKSDGNDNDKEKKEIKQSTSLSRMYLQNNYRLFNSNNNIYKIQRNNFYSCNNSTTNIFNVVQNNSNSGNINKHEKCNNYGRKGVYSNVTMLHMKPHNEHVYVQRRTLLDHFHPLPNTLYTRRAISSSKKRHLLDKTYNNYSANINNNKYHHNHQHSVISTHDILHKTKQLFSKASSSSSSTSLKHSNLINHNKHYSNGVTSNNSLSSSTKYNKLYNYN